MKQRTIPTEAEFLRSYDPSKYERPSVTVDMVIFTVTDREQKNYRKLPEKDLKVLLIKRGGHPYRGAWALPGGFVNPDENLHQAAARELAEETGIRDVYMEQLYTWGDPDRDPRTRVISCSYMALVDSADIRLRAGDDADDARWFTIVKRLQHEKRAEESGSIVRNRQFALTLTSDEMEMNAEIEKTITTTGKLQIEDEQIVQPGKLAFDHARIISYALDRLRNKIEHTNIAFHLVPERFTLTQLQQVYDTILDREELKASFRRKIEGKVIETDQFADSSGHRPSKLYRMKPLE